MTQQFTVTQTSYKLFWNCIYFIYRRIGFGAWRKPEGQRWAETGGTSALGSHNRVIGDFNFVASTLKLTILAPGAVGGGGWRGCKLQSVIWWVTVARKWAVVGASVAAIDSITGFKEFCSIIDSSWVPSQARFNFGLFTISRNHVTGFSLLILLFILNLIGLRVILFLVG